MIDHAIDVMPFGKYADQPLDQIPEQYLLWLVTGTTGGLDDGLVSAIRGCFTRTPSGRSRRYCAGKRWIANC